MVQISRFWDGTALGDATVAPYDAGTEFSEVMSAVSGAAGMPDKGGIIKGAGSDLGISQPSAGVVQIGPGEAMVYGSWYKSDTNTQHNIATPAAAARSDILVLRKSWTDQTVRQLIVVGTEGGAAPTLTKVVGDTWDVPIATIAITTTGTITITDRRVMLGIPDSNLIFTDPIIRDTLFFGAKPSGSADASIERTGPNQLVAPGAVFTANILQADGPLATERAFKALTNGVMRWFWGIAGGVAEPGANVGSDQGLYRYADDGSFLGAVVGYRRSDGLITHHSFTNFRNPTQWGDGQRVWQEGGNLVWRRQSDSAGTMVLGDNGNISNLGDIGAGGAVFANGGYVYAGSAAGNYLRMGFGGDLFANNGQSITVNPTSAYFHGVNTTVRLGHPSIGWYDVYTQHVSCTGQGVFDGGVRGNGGVFTISSAANIQLSPGGGIVHPDTNGTRPLGTTNLEWSDVFARRVYSGYANPLLIESLSVQLHAYGGGSPVNLFSDSGQMQFQCGDGFAIFPLRHNTNNFGTSAVRWIAGYGVSGWNSGSTREWKQNWSDLPEGLALSALRLMRFGRFEYKVPESVQRNEQVDPAHALNRWTVGYIAEDTVEVTGLVGAEDLFVSRTGRDVEPQRTASTIGAAVQDLDREVHQQIAELRARIVELEREVVRVYANGIS